jgi:integrase
MSKSDKRQPSSPREPIQIAVDEALEAYLSRRETESKTTQGTVDTHRKRLNHLIEYCELEEIEYVSDLRGHDIEQYREWRRTEATEKVDVLSPKTLQEHMKTIRVFMRAMESMEYVTPGMADRVYVPEIEDEDETSDEILEYDRAEEILSHIAKAESGKAEEVVWRLFVGSGLRLGTVHSIDVPDVYLDAEIPHIELRNRPEEGTNLKNRDDSERRVFITEETAEAIEQYLQYNHPKVTDDCGRMPLIGTSHGRANPSTIRGMVYKWTRPCELGGTCPHGKQPSSCETAGNRDKPSDCPSTRSPHDIRRGYITHASGGGVPPRILSDRVDAELETLEKYYDKNNDEEKMEARKELIERIMQDEEEVNY